MGGEGSTLLACLLVHSDGKGEHTPLRIFREFGVNVTITLRVSRKFKVKVNTLFRIPRKFTVKVNTALWIPRKFTVKVNALLRVSCAFEGGGRGRPCVLACLFTPTVKVNTPIADIP